MTETYAVSIEDVRTLVTERQRYDDWLTALEAKRAETPERVFARVHGDYSARRATVMERLQNHLGEIASLADQLDSRLAALDASLSSLEDERAEAMLRTAVGEFDSERWEAVRQEVEAKIETISEERGGLLAEVEDVRTLLDRARSEPGRPVPAQVASQVSAPAPAVPAVEAATPVMAAETVAAVEPVDLTPESDANVAVTPGAELSSERANAQPERDALDLDDALALFTPSHREATPPNNAGIEIVGGNSPARPTGVPQADDDPFDDLAFLRSVTDSAPSTGAATRAQAPAATSQKTLRCTECGTMNLPTEWYCERCGGELAAF